MSILLTVAPTLTANVWTKILAERAVRKSLYLDNRSSSEVYLYFGENPWAVNFDGTNDTVTVDGLAGNTEFLKSTTGSIEARVRVTNNAGVKTIFAVSDTNANEYLALYFDASEKLCASLRKAAAVQWTLECQDALTVDTWYTVKLLHNGTTPILYVNGLKPEQWFTVTTAKTAWMSALSGIDNARIGDNYFSSSEANFFYGVISDVKVRYGVATNGTSGTLVAHWQMDEGANTSLADAAGGYTGTMVGATWVNKDLALMRLGTGWSWDHLESVPVQAVWGLTTGSGVVVGGTEGI